MVGIDFEARGLQRLQSCGVAVQKGTAILQQDVGEVVEPALSGDVGVELADGAGGGIAGVREQRQALGFALLIHLLERCDRHKQFAAHLEVCRDA